MVRKIAQDGGLPWEATVLGRAPLARVGTRSGTIIKRARDYLTFLKEKDEAGGDKVTPPRTVKPERAADKSVLIITKPHEGHGVWASAQAAAAPTNHISIRPLPWRSCCLRTDRRACARKSYRSLKIASFIKRGSCGTVAGGAPQFSLGRRYAMTWIVGFLE
jgi:hypothetical protein